MASDDARLLLKADGNLQVLSSKLAAHLERLDSMHVEEVVTGSNEYRLSYDVSYVGRCSGQAVIKGGSYPMVTDDDGRTLLQGIDGSQRWTEVPLVIGEYCLGGPLNVATHTDVGTGRTSTLFEAKRVGTEKVAGWDAVHFRRVDGSLTLDSWLVADGPMVRLVKLVRRFDNGNTTTLHFSRFDSADALAPEPAPDQVELLGAS